MPKVSIIIPTYKRTHFLKEALKNVHKQTFKDFEVIVVDDGTPGDENEKICLQYSDVVYKKIYNTGGPMRPRNIGMKLAKGEYIAFLDDDDLWIPDKLQRQVDILDNEKDFGLVHGCCMTIDKDGNELETIIGSLDNNMRKHGYVFDDMVGNFTLMMPTVFFRKELLDIIGGFNESMHPAGEDTEFFCRLAFHTKFYFLKEPVAIYRFHANNLSVKDEYFFYIYLPLSLYKMVKKFKDIHCLENKRFKKIRNRLLEKQVEEIFDKRRFIIALKNCFSIYWLFWTKPKVMYILFKKCLIYTKLLIFGKKTNR